MKWIILIGDESFGLDTVRAIKYHKPCIVSDLENNRFVVEFVDGHIFYDFVEDMLDDYEDDERVELPYAQPHFIMLTYSSLELLKEIFLQDVFLENIYVDDDNGRIMTLEAFREYIKTRPATLA